MGWETNPNDVRVKSLEFRVNAVLKFQYPCW